MSVARFPTKRDDGTVSVAARFTFDARAAVGAAESLVKDWVVRRVAERINLAEDLATDPYVVVRSDDTLDVVFEGRPGRSLWKDWMVAITEEMTSTVPSVKFACFYDLVGDIEHPASRSRP
jgi:hypothetical protein